MKLHNLIHHAVSTSLLLSIAVASCSIAGENESSCSCSGGACDELPDAEAEAIRFLQLRAARTNTVREEAALKHKSPVSLVNVLAGTNSRADISAGNTLPIIARPWGFNHWTVQTKPDLDSFWFNPSDVSFYGLRCTHQPSPWIGDYGHFLILPVFRESSERGGDLKGDSLSLDGVPANETRPTGALGLYLSSSAGMYQPATALFRPYAFRSTVMMEGEEEKGSIEFELAPSMHGALLRVTLPRGQAGGLKFSLPSESGDGPSWEEFDNGTVVGLTSAKAEDPPGLYPKNFGMHIVIEAVDSPDAQWEVDQQLGVATLWFSADEREASSKLVRLATSFISATQAKTSIAQELSGKAFDVLMAESRESWDSLMRRVQVEFPDESRAAVFYTNLYRGMLFPRVFWEQNKAGELVHWSAYDGRVLPGRAVTDQGFWDAYRTVYPMLSLIFPEKLGEMTEGWINAYKEAGWLPTWASPGQRQSMVGTMGDCSLADAIVKHKQGLISGFNITTAFEAILRDSMEVPDEFALELDLGRSALKDYIASGYVPSDNPIALQNAMFQTAALTLNYQMADACVSLAAEAMGQRETAEVLRKRSKQFGTLFDKSTRHFRPRTMTGAWDDTQGSAGGPLGPITWGRGFTEAAAVHYRFYVPHDVPGLASLFGGEAKLCQEIQAMFQKSEDSQTAFVQGTFGQTIHEMRETAAVEVPFGLYAHGNQPVHDVLWVAASAGCKNLAHRYLRKVIDELYTIDGWSGDEDNGEMASWYILSSLGLYSLMPGSDDLVVGSPEVLEATISVPGRRPLTIKGNGNSASAVYVTSVNWNNQTVQGTTVQYSQLAKGGVLTFSMAAEPATSSIF